MGRTAGRLAGRAGQWFKSLAPRFADDAFNTGTTVARTAPRAVTPGVTGRLRHGAQTAAAGAWHGLSRGALGPTFSTAQRFLGRAPTQAEQWLFTRARGAGDWIRRHPDLTALGASFAGAETPANLYFWGRYPVASAAFSVGGMLGGPSGPAMASPEISPDALAALLSNWSPQMGYGGVETPDYYGQLFGS